MKKPKPNLQLHVQLDAATHDLLARLGVSLEASTASEVVRRALQEFEFRGGTAEALPPGTECRFGFYRVSEDTKARLDRLARRHGVNYREALTAAIRAFEGPVLETEALRAAGVRRAEPPPVF